MGLNGVATRRFFFSVCGVLVSGVSVGCATREVRSSSPYARELPISFKDDAVKRQMTSLGLTAPFVKYWEAHAHRRWADRYRMERFTGELAESFYVAYHDAAWMIQDFGVVKLHEPDQMGRIRVDVDVTYQSLIEPNKTNRQLVPDWWINDGGEWWHINVDPMLNGMRSVL